MTDPKHTKPVVTQADRIMCARAVATVEQEHLKSAILRGDYDYTEAMKAFVAHRTATIENELGYAFEETNGDRTMARRAAYLVAMERAPEVSQVLEEAFAERFPIRSAAA